MVVGRISGKAAAEQLVGVEEMLRKQSERQLEQIQNGGRERMETRTVADAVREANTNAMGGNAAGNRIDPESSRYVEAGLASLATPRQQKNIYSAARATDPAAVPKPRLSVNILV